MKADCVVCGKKFEKCHPSAVLCGWPKCFSAYTGENRTVRTESVTNTKNDAERIRICVICNKAFRKQRFAKLCGSKACAAARNKQKKKRWEQANRDAHLESRRKFYSKNRERCLQIKRDSRSRNPEIYRERCRKWYWENAEYARACSRDWARNNSEKHRARQRKYYQEHPEKKLEAGRRYRASNPDKERQRHRLYNLTHAKQIAESRIRRRAVDPVKTYWSDRKNREASYDPEYHREWRKANIEKVRSYSRKFQRTLRAAKKLGIPRLLYAALKIKDSLTQTPENPNVSS